MNKEIKFLGKTFKNPIIPASGTFGFGYEFASYYDINILGSISLKGTTLEPRYGNPLPRIAECDNGLLNSIGLQNPGVDKVISEELVKLKKVYSDQVIANVGGHSLEDYVETVRKLSKEEQIFAIELNISCPNVSSGGMSVGVNPTLTKELVRRVKEVSTKPIIVKLSPNVTNIVEIALAAEEGGCDAISLINTLVGMRIDLKTGKPILGVKKGGYSGKGVFPVALRMVYEVSKVVKVPLIGMGGISSAYDVIEMMYAGASLVMVGSENLINPYACKEIIEDLDRVMEELHITNLEDIIKGAHKYE